MTLIRIPKKNSLIFIQFRYKHFPDELNLTNINNTKELKGTGIKLEFCEDFESSTHSIPFFAALVYFIDDSKDPNNLFTPEEELLLRKRIMEYFGNVQDLRDLW